MHEVEVIEQGRQGGQLASVLVQVISEHEQTLDEVGVGHAARPGGALYGLCAAQNEPLRTRTRQAAPSH